MLALEWTFGFFFIRICCCCSIAVLFLGFHVAFYCSIVVTELIGHAGDFAFISFSNAKFAAFLIFVFTYAWVVCIPRTSLTRKLNFW